MRLTSFTDYTLRTLMYLAAHRDRLCTVAEIVALHQISQNHLTKVVHQLGLSGLIETVRGRNGGLRLNREPEEINIGAVVRMSETDFHMAECFDKANNTCLYNPACVLKHTFARATQAYLEVLDGVTLADLVPQGGALPERTPLQPVRG